MKDFFENVKIKVLISANGEYFTDSLHTENGVIMIPAWEIFSKMGAKIEWREDEKVLVARTESDVFFVRVGLNGVVLNGQLVPLPIETEMIGDTVYIPTEAVEKGFGATVMWFEKAKTLCIWKKKEEKIEPVQKTEGKSLEEIWQIGEETSFIIEMHEYLSEKCDYGEDIERLNDKQRVFYITQSLETEVNSGGFDQFFFNTGGNFANELVWAFNEIGAIKTAEICKRAIGAFGQNVPCDRFERQDVMESFNDEVSTLWSECDRSFLEYEDNLHELNYNYVMKNKNSFSD